MDTQEVSRLTFMAPRFLQCCNQQVLGHGVQVKVLCWEQVRSVLSTSWTR